MVAPRPRVDVATFDLFLTCLTSLDYRADIAEVRGGEARASTFAAQRHLKAGQNFDLAAGVALNDPGQQVVAGR